MDINTLQYVVGEVKADAPATIRFFGSVTEDNTSRFNDEFDFLENVIRPSCIRVLINPEGGSVLYGMSTYSTIANSKVDTECIIEGVAASMASIIWAAGKRSLMRDYAILMIHNPMMPSSEDMDVDTKAMVKAFTKQIETIYRKRFGLKAEHVRAIMDGEAGRDGTYFDVQAAVKAGIIPAENIIHTSKQLCEKVHSEVASMTETTAIQELMSRVSAENKLFENNIPTLKQTVNDMANENKTQGFELHYFSKHHDLLKRAAIQIVSQTAYGLLRSYPRYLQYWEQRVRDKYLETQSQSSLANKTGQYYKLISEQQAVAQKKNYTDTIVGRTVQDYLELSISK